MYFNLRLFALSKGLRPRIALAAIVGMLALAAGVARLALTGWLIGRVFQGDGLSSLGLPLIVLGVLIAVRGQIQYLRDSVSYSTATRTKIEIRRQLYSHIVNLGPAFIERRRTGDLLMSLVDAVESLETFFGQYLPQFIVALTAPVLIFIYMAWLDLQIGLIFLGFQVFEFHEFGAEGLNLSTNQFGASFFVLTGFHGAHVTVGVLMLGSLLVGAMRRTGLGSESGFHVETVGLYWHFVDIVWIVIFTIIYLMPA